MSNLSEDITISELSNLINTNGIQSIEHITKETNLRKLYIILKHYQNGIKTGINNNTNFSLDFILNQVTETNINDICKILTCSLQIQDDNKECNKLLKKYSETISLVNLKIFNILLDNTSISTELIHECMSQTFNEQEEYKYFITNILPKFLLKDTNTTIKLIITMCYKDNSLEILASVNSQYLFTDSFLNVLNTNQFWRLLIEELLTDGYKYKCAMYLFKLSLDVLRKVSNTPINTDYIFNESLKPDDKSFDYFCILLDISKEKQLHLIEPSLHLLNIINLPNMWLNIIYNKLLCHPHNLVAYNSLLYFFKHFSTQNLDFSPLFVALNKNDDSKLVKYVYKCFQSFCLGLDQPLYEDLIVKSLKIIWIPVACYKFYKNALIRHLNLDILIEIIKNCKKVPQKYIRQGCMFIIFTKIKNLIKNNGKESISKYMNIILEFMSDHNGKSDEIFYKYGTKLINLSNLQVPLEFLDELLQSLLCKTLASNIKTKVDFLIELTERKDVPGLLVKKLYQDFKARKYSLVVLDRLSYLYLIKPIDLQEYLLERLDSTEYEESCAIRQMDKPGYDLITKSIHIVTSTKSTIHVNQQVLAFEILFYMTKSNYNLVYNYWFNKILNSNELITHKIALNFVNLLLKIPNGFGKQNFVKLLSVYENFFNCQRDDVLVKIYRNFDFVLETMDDKHLEFLDLACNKISFLKAREDVENSIRYLVRSVALNYKEINKKVLEFLLRKLYGFTGNERCADFVIYYCTMYFKYLNFDIDLYPMYEFLLYPNCILDKNERAEYEICNQIYLDLHTPSPYFRSSEIRKWALEDILFDQNPRKVTGSVNYLLKNYRKTFNKRYFPDSTLHLQKLRTIQILIFMLPSIINNSGLKESVLTFLIQSFTQESHQPSVRLLMQYLLIQLLKDEQSSLEQVLSALDSSSKTHTSTVTGFLPVIYGLDLIKNNAEFSHKVIESVLAWTMGPHFKLRYYAQKLIKEVCLKHQHNYKFKKYDAIFKAVDTSIKATTVKDDLDFDIAEYIFNEKPWKDSKKLVYIITVHIPEVCNVTPCEWEYFKVKQFWSKYLKENIKTDEGDDEKVDLDFLNSKEDMIGCNNIQKKIIPWQDALENDSDDQSLNNKKGKLIIVTSLIESAANLGGLSRTCEIFGGQILVVDNIKVVEKKEFSNLSLTSEKWVNITEVKACNLPEFLLKCKEDRYRIVGVEQTSESSSLESYKFHEKTVLLLGNERAGIPAPLIGLMDDCVEIPQFGMIRSLNVHVAGALVVWEYAKQQMIK